MIQEGSKEEGQDGAGDGDDDDGRDNIPLSTRLQAMRAQFPLPAGDPAAKDVAIVDIPDSSKETGRAGLVQPRAEPIPYSHPKPKSSAVIGGMFTPDEPSFVDLRGDPNTVSSESSSSSEESKNFINYSTNKDPSPSHPSTFEILRAPSTGRLPRVCWSRGHCR